MVDMQSFMPPLSPTKVRMLSPSKLRDENTDPATMEDGCIEIPDSAGLSDETRDAIYNVWATEDTLINDDSGFVDGVHYLRVDSPL